MAIRVLFVDDDEELLEIFSATFSAWKFEVFLARNGEEFYTQAFKNNPQVIVLDIMLDRENGVEVYNRLLSKGLDAKIPVIFLSSLASDRMASPAVPGRNYALRGKPIRMEDLCREIVCLTNDA